MWTTMCKNGKAACQELQTVQTFSVSEAILNGGKNNLNESEQKIYHGGDDE